jgi:glycosyltransferase involved in cell wall biosynthesis
MTLPTMPIGGMESVVARLTRGLLRRGHDVGITCTETIGLFGEQLSAEGLRVTVVPTLGLRTILFPSALIAWLRALNPDVVHTHSGSWHKSAFAAKRAGVRRVIHTEHGVDIFEPWFTPPVKRWAARHTDVVVSVSRPLERDLHSRAGIPEERLMVLPNGIDTSAFTPGPRSGVVRRAFGLDDDRIVLGHVARFSPEKNQLLLVDAFARLHAQHPKVFLALVGEGALRSALEQRARDREVGAHVGFFGYANDLPPIYRDFDIFVLPSLAEGTSMSVLEAMATGLAVVATDVGGNADVLANGEVGRLVPSNDVTALTDALVSLVADPDRRSALGRVARTRAVEVYEEERVIDRYEELYLSRARTRPTTFPISSLAVQH